MKRNAGGARQLCLYGADERSTRPAHRSALQPPNHPPNHSPNYPPVQPLNHPPNPPAPKRPPNHLKRWSSRSATAVRAMVKDDARPPAAEAG